jgi:enolase-phosphatase E1
VSVSLSALHVRALLLDIEGTTTPIEFVHTVLFPYARSHIPGYLAGGERSPLLAGAIEQLRREHAEDRAQGCEPPEPLVDYISWLMDRDRKSPGLKALQGLVWCHGYAGGQLRGEVYPDVPPAFERWRAGRLAIYIYSSGSVLAQQLLFGSVPTGDLTTCLSGFFDTGVDAKSSPGSYRNIAAHAALPPSAMLFVSDVVAELDAALEAGFHTLLCIRDAKANPEPDVAHRVIRSFDEIVE